MTLDDLMNFVQRGRVAQEEVDKIITKNTQAQQMSDQRGVPQRRAPAPNPKRQAAKP